MVGASGSSDSGALNALTSNSLCELFEGPTSPPAAVACRTDYLVTFNLKDFASPSAVVAITPSVFMKSLMGQNLNIVEEHQ